MLSGTRKIYSQTFAAPGVLLVKRVQEEGSETGDEKGKEKENEESESGESVEKMLIIQPRKRSRTARAVERESATSHPASWQADAGESTRAEAPIALMSLSASDAREQQHTGLSRAAVAGLSLAQLQQLGALVEERIQIKQRYNNTPLRRILARQVSVSGETYRDTPTLAPESDTCSQTDTLVNGEAQEVSVARESAEVRRARYNNTPLRRILSRQTSVDTQQDAVGRESATQRYAPEPEEVRRARYNNTPLRRIVSRQVSREEKAQVPSVETSSTPSPSQSSPPVPRSNTPLRRILSRQASTQKPTPPSSPRADSVLDPSSPVRARRQPSPSPSASPARVIPQTSEARIRAYEESVWNKATPTASHSPSTDLTAEARIRAYEELVWGKTSSSHGSNGDSDSKTLETSSRRTVITVEEIPSQQSTTMAAKKRDVPKPNRIVVDSKGSPLRRILQRQTSRDWRAPARVGVV